MRIFIGVFLLLGCTTACAQSVQKIEQELLTAFKKILAANTDSLKSANTQFSARRTITKPSINIGSVINWLQKKLLSQKATWAGIFPVFTC